jgi:hypothetical protein
VIKSRTWEGHIIKIGTKEKAYEMLIEKQKGKRYLRVRGIDIRITLIRSLRR